MRQAFSTPAGIWLVDSCHPDTDRFLHSFLRGFAQIEADASVSPNLQIQPHGTSFRIVTAEQALDVDENDLLPALDLCLREQMIGWLTGELVLHAAVIGRNNKAVLIAGASGSGKSTLTVAWHQNGAQVWGDEYAWLMLDGTGLEVRAWPRPWEINHRCNDPLLLAAESRMDRFGYPMRSTEGTCLYASYYCPESWPAPAPVVGIIFLTGEEGDMATVDHPAHLLQAWLGNEHQDRMLAELTRLPLLILGRSTPSQMVHSVEHFLTGIV